MSGFVPLSGEDILNWLSQEWLSLAGFLLALTLGLETLFSSSLFSKPQLKIHKGYNRELDDGRWGKLKEKDGAKLNEFFPKRRFIGIIVKNTGRKIATNCEARSRLINKTEGCQWLSEEPKPLLWIDGSDKISISAKGGEAIFYIAFSQERLTTEQEFLIKPVNCGITKGLFSARCWMGTKTALKNTGYADQDGLCQGDFKVHVKVSADTGDATSKDFTIKVGDNWKVLDADISECNCRE